MTANNNYMTVKCNLHWAKLDRVDDMSGKYGVQLSNLSDAAVNALAAWEVDVKERQDKPEYGRYIKCASKFEIVAVDENDQPVKGYVGNGSEAIVKLKRREWTYMKKTGVATDIQKLTITKLVNKDGDSGDSAQEVVL